MYVFYHLSTLSDQRLLGEFPFGSDSPHNPDFDNIRSLILYTSPITHHPSIPSSFSASSRIHIPHSNLRPHLQPQLHMINISLPPSPLNPTNRLSERVFPVHDPNSTSRLYFLILMFGPASLEMYV